MPNFLDNLISRYNAPKQAERSTDTDYWSPIFGTLGFSSYNQYSTNKALKLSTVYRCVEVISSSIAVLPLQTYTIKENWKFKEYGELWNLLNIQPNSNQSAYTFKKMIVQLVLLKGNAYIKINRDGKSNIVSFELLDSDFINVLIDGVVQNFNSQIISGKKEYQNLKTGFVYDDADIIHIMNYSTNGIVGISTISSAALTLEIAYNSDQHASNFFESGANMNAVLTPAAGSPPISPDKARLIKEKLQESVSATDGKSGGIAIIGVPLDLKPFSISPKDSQLLESRAFNILNICQFFGVPPTKVFDKGTYSSNEAQQIEFLNSTILSWCEKIEIEAYRKIYSKIEYAFTELEFDTSKLLRLDAAAQATYFSQLYQLGAISTNEIRQQINMSYPVAGGNKHFIQVNLQDINNLIADKNNSIDNQMK